MIVQFREAVEADIPAVVGLLRDDILGKDRETNEFAHYLAAFRAMMKTPGNRIYVGETEEEIVATYQMTLIDGLSLSASRRAQLEGVRVAAGMRGQGIGARMMSDAISRAKAEGCELVQLTANKLREDAHRFYNQAGFTDSHLGFKMKL